MKADFSLYDMHHHGLCKAVERSGVICFNEKHSKGYCYKHYARIRRYGSVTLPIKPEKRCRFLDCKQSHYSSGYCKAHYAKHSRLRSTKKCEAEGCDKTCIGKFCPMHRARLERYGVLSGSGKKKGGGIDSRYIRQKEYKVCLDKHCGRNSDGYKITKGLCPKHYQRWRKTGQYNLPSISIMENFHGTAERPEEGAEGYEGIQ